MVTFSSLADLPTPIGLAAAKKTEMTGPPPFTTGDIGGITAGGSTSIGAGLGIALLAFGSGSTNDRAILLLSDGLQNTLPMVEEIEGFLGATKLNVIGFGSDADIDGPLLSRVARQHGGQFTRAVDGLGLRKFFGLAFGNIFEAGALGDPEYVLPAGQDVSDPHTFSVCGEEQITLILGWDDPSNPLRGISELPAASWLVKGGFGRFAAGIGYSGKYLCRTRANEMGRGLSQSNASPPGASSHRRRVTCVTSFSLCVAVDRNWSILVGQDGYTPAIRSIRWSGSTTAMEPPRTPMSSSS
jgi:hypothetical protein